ncbi:MAG: hypothetical protein GW778_07240 [Alphaproteobacteria bacterium]|nr:hypothetical protein [Alphaproteobacteria bacterium]
MDYYKSLEARAWLEAQREITQNQNLIYKPDSVLEYTCFDNHLRGLAEHAKDMFSETQRWSPAPIPVGHMKTSLEALISNALVSYDNANFNASLLGGRLTASGGWGGSAPSEASGDAYAFESSIGSGAYACDIMQAVWQKAKCLNFVAIAASDGFFTFDDYASGNDKRFPAGSCASVASEFGTKIDEALPPAGATTPWERDPVKTKFEDFFPTTAGCGTGGPSRLKTGLVVEDNSRNDQPPYFYFEHVCLVPGCHWKPSGAGPDANNPAGAGDCIL